jgi:hypothetical protein
MTPQRLRIVLRFELLWWAFTLLAVAVILAPVAYGAQGYPFWADNILFIVSFITLSRHIFLLQHTFLANTRYPKAVLIFASIPFIFYLIQQLNGFQTFLDENGPEALVGFLSIEKTIAISGYVRTQMVLFAVGAIISAVILPFRMLVSIWRLWNLGKE